MKKKIVGALFIAFSFNTIVLATESYSVVQDEPNIGTHVKKEFIRGGNLPFDKRYEELTGEQIRILRSSYQDLRDNDEPPFPRDGMTQMAREIGKAQNTIRARGNLFLSVQIDEHGDAQSVSIFDTPDRDLSKVVAFILMNAKYKPAKCDGKPCAMDFPFRFQFHVRLNN